MTAMLGTLRFIVTHPLNRRRPIAALAAYARWQLGSRLLGGSVAVPFVGDTRLLVARGMTGATGNVYCGLHEFEDMGFVLHALRHDDLFVDVGANVGAYSILAAGACGASVVAVEANGQTYSALLDNVRLNGLEARVDAQHVASGALEGVVRFSSELDTVNHVLAPDEVGHVAAEEVRVVPLDTLLDGRAPFAIKIDVEGFETEVLRGAARTLALPELQAVVVELNGSGARYGYDDLALHTQLTALGFTPCAYAPQKRELTPQPTTAKPGAQGNAIYVRNVALLRDRIRSAPRYRVRGREI